MIPTLAGSCLPEQQLNTPARRTRAYFRSPAADWAAPQVKKRYHGSWYIPKHNDPTVPCWNSPTQWILTVQCVLSTNHGRDVARRWAVKHATIIAVAKVDAGTADANTGRNVCTAHATVARTLGCSPKTVQRARAVMRDLDLVHEAERGRYLTRAERMTAHLATGSRQIKIATTRHLITPRKHRLIHVDKTPRPKSQKKNVHLPRSGALQGSSSSSVVTKRTPARALTHSASLDMQKLAAAIDKRLPWLCRGKHIGHLIRVLIAAGIDPTRTTAAKIITSIEAAGCGWLHMRSQKNPLAWFATGLTTAKTSETQPLHYNASPTRPDRAPGVPQTACTDPACDGHGWHNHTINGRPVVSRCPQR